MNSLSWLEEIYWSEPWPSIGRVWFETQLPLLMDFGVALSGAVVLVSCWSAGAVPEAAGGSVPSKELVGMIGGIDRSSGWKMTHQTSETASLPPPLFSPPFSGGLEIAPTLHLSLEIAGWLVWLQQFSEWITTCTESFCLLAISRGWPLADRFWQLHATPPINVASRSSLEGPLQGGGLGVS